MHFILPKNMRFQIFGDRLKGITAILDISNQWNIFYSSTYLRNIWLLMILFQNQGITLERILLSMVKWNKIKEMAFKAHKALIEEYN